MKRVALIILLVLLASPLLVFAGGQKELTSAQKQRGIETQNMAVEIAEALKGRFGDMHDTIISKGDRDNPEYREFQKVLAGYVEKFGVTYVYTLIKISDDMTNLIVDAAEDEYADDYGTEYEMEPQMESAFAGNPDYAKHIWEDDDFGWQISAFAPLYNSAGKLVALIGVDAPL